MMYAITMHCTACFGPYSSVTPEQKIVHLPSLTSTLTVRGGGVTAITLERTSYQLPMGSVMLTCCLVVRQIPYLKDAKAELMRKAESIPPSFFSTTMFNEQADTKFLTHSPSHPSCYCSIGPHQLDGTSRLKPASSCLLRPAHKPQTEETVPKHGQGSRLHHHGTRTLTQGLSPIHLARELAQAEHHQRIQTPHLRH